MSAEKWVQRPKKAKRGDSWAKPKRTRRKKKLWGADPKAAKEAKKWGKPQKEKGPGLFDRIGGKSRRASWLSKWLSPQRVSLVKYYHRLDEVVQGSALSDRGDLDEDQEHTNAGTQIARWIERLIGRRLSGGQINQVQDYAKENKFSIKDLGAMALKIFTKL